MIYQHATSERDREIAAALDLMIAEARAAVGNVPAQSRDQDDDGSNPDPSRVIWHVGT